MAVRTGRTKFLYWIFGAFVVIAVFSFAVARYFAIKLKPVVKQELRRVVKSATNDLYNIDFQKVSINFLTGNAYLTKVNITADSTVYGQLVGKKVAPNNRYNIQLERLTIKNVHPLKIYFKKVLEIDQILFDKPCITMINDAQEYNKNKPPRPDESPYGYVKKFFKRLNVKSIDFKDARFKFVDNNGSKQQVDTLSNVTVTLKDWLIDEKSAMDTSRFYLLKDANVYVNDYRFATPDSMYYIKASQFEFNASSKKVNIKSFVLEPRYSEANFCKVLGFGRDRYSLNLNNLDIHGLDLPSFIKNREVYIDELNIANGVVSVFYDNTYTKEKKDKTGKFPHQILQRLKIPFTIRKIALQKVDINYAELSKRSLRRGAISFNHTSGTIVNVTNHPKYKRENPWAEANLETYLMKQGKLNVGFKFNLIAPKADFSYQGQMLHMDGRQLNHITKPVGMVQIKNCLVRRLAFDINANEDYAKGKVEFIYNDLSLGLMKRKDGQDRLERLGILSLLANAMFLESDNPSVNGKTRVAEVLFQRNHNASFFNFVWQALFQGVKHSVGFTPQKELEIKKYVNQFGKMKSDREKRRLRRGDE